MRQYYGLYEVIQVMYIYIHIYMGRFRVGECRFRLLGLGCGHSACIRAGLRPPKPDIYGFSRWCSHAGSHPVGSGPKGPSTQSSYT